MSEIKVQLEEVKEIYLLLLLEKLQNFMHQSTNYESKEDFQSFVSHIYPEIHKSYYETVWNWLPENVQKEIEER